MDSKRLDASTYDTDKAQYPHYLRTYEDYFRPLLDKDIRLLELGIFNGGSLLLWRDYFERGLIVGLDIESIRIDDTTGRIRVYRGAQQDRELLDRIARETAPEGFDVIIDDCSHIGELTRISFWHLFDKHLKPGGLYVIEDWSASYWDSWFDGIAFSYQPSLRFSPTLFRVRSLLARIQRRVPRLNFFIRRVKGFINYRQFRSHNYGLVGFIKELVDECAMADITRADRGKPPYRPSKIRHMRISPGQVFIVKA